MGALPEDRRAGKPGKVAANRSSACVTLSGASADAGAGTKAWAPASVPAVTHRTGFEPQVAVIRGFSSGKRRVCLCSLEA